MLGKRLRDIKDRNSDDAAFAQRGRVEHKTDADALRCGLEHCLARFQPEQRRQTETSRFECGVEFALRLRATAAKQQCLPGEIRQSQAGAFGKRMRLRHQRHQ